MKVALTLAVVAAFVFLFFLLKKFLNVMRFSAKTIMCLAAVAMVAALVWSKRLPPDENAGEEVRPLQRISLRK